MSFVSCDINPCFFKYYLNPSAYCSFWNCFMWFYNAYECVSLFLKLSVLFRYSSMVEYTLSFLLLGYASSFSGSGLKPDILCFIFWDISINYISSLVFMSANWIWWSVCTLDAFNNAIKTTNLSVEYFSDKFVTFPLFMR